MHLVSEVSCKVAGSEHALEYAWESLTASELSEVGSSWSENAVASDRANRGLDNVWQHEIIQLTLYEMKQKHEMITNCTN